MKIFDIVIYCLSIFITETILVFNYGQLSNQKLKINNRNLFILICMSILVYINNYYNLISIRYLTAIVITIISTKLIYKNKLKDCIFYSIIHSILYIFMELILSPLMLLKIENITILNNEIYLKCIFSILIGILSLYLFKSKILLDFIDKIKTIVYTKINLYVVLIIISLFLNFIGVFRAFKTNNIDLIIVTLVCILFMLLTIKIIINDKYNLTVINERNKNIKDYFKAYSKTIDDCRELKHNLKNDLYTIKSILPKEEQEKINVIINKYNKNYEWINRIDEIPEGLQGLIYLKQKEAKNKKIKIYVNTGENYKTNDRDYIDLCSILGVLIDNALEASEKSKEKIIEITFRKKDTTLNIRIINTYINDININKIGKKNYSTKEYKSGLGLNYVNKLNNPKIKVIFKVINNLFITDIIYNYKK